VRPFLLIALAACAIGTALAQEEIAKSEFVVEFDPYYSDIGYNIPLTDKPIPTITSDSEMVIYRELIQDSFPPRYMTLEASVNPMPVLGTYLKTHQRGLYDSGQIGGGENYGYTGYLLNAGMKHIKTTRWSMMTGPSRNGR